MLFKIFLQLALSQSVIAEVQNNNQINYILNSLKKVEAFNKGGTNCGAGSNFKDCSQFPKLINVPSYDKAGKIIEGSMTGMEKRYRIIKEKLTYNKNKYIAKINMNILGDNDGALKDRIKKCVNAYGNKLYDSVTEQFELKVDFPTQNELNNQLDEPILVDIKLGVEGSRTHSRNYAIDIDCPTIMHELMHLLGLVDEYEEKDIAYYIGSDGDIADSGNPITKFNCRLTGPRQSLMHDQETAFEQRLGGEGSVCCCNSSLNGISDCVSNFSASINHEKIYDLSPIIDLQYCSLMHSSTAYSVTNPINYDEVNKFIELKISSPRKGINDDNENYVRVYSYKCDCNLVDCEKINKIANDAASKGILRQNELFFSEPQICPLSAPKKLKDDCILGDKGHSYPAPQGANSLLYPAQFRAIINGNCADESVLNYNLGAGLASQTKDDVESCQNIKKNLRDKKWSEI